MENDAAWKEAFALYWLDKKILGGVELIASERISRFVCDGIMSVVHEYWTHRRACETSHD